MRGALTETAMLTVGDPLPAFALKAAMPAQAGRELVQVTRESFPGQWLVLFFWPIDFTAVCPTEILAFAEHDHDFRARGARLIGASSDSVWVHVAWRHRDADLRDVPFPMLGDASNELARALGILDERVGVAMRATFLVDPERVIRWASVHDVRCGRSVNEVLRVLDALRTGKQTPCEWRPGEATLLA
jgi:peroxiredoxin (alkyl hydroperoxide reductase subunit C)